MIYRRGIDEFSEHSADRHGSTAAERVRAKPEQQALVLEGKTMGTVWRVSLAGVDAQRKAALPAIHPRAGASAADRRRDGPVGPLVNLGLWPAQQPAHTPSDAAIAAAKAQTGLQHLRVIETVNGQWLQKDLPPVCRSLHHGRRLRHRSLARLMELQGITNYLVSVGGAVLSRGLNASQQPWRVAIQKPTDRENAVEARVDLQGHGISTSGSYRNYYELDGKRISHVIDPAVADPSITGWSQPR